MKSYITKVNLSQRQQQKIMVCIDINLNGLFQKCFCQNSCCSCHNHQIAAAAVIIVNKGGLMNLTVPFYMYYSRNTQAACQLVGMMIRSYDKHETIQRKS